MTNRIPSVAKPENIGRVVTVLLWDKDENGEIDKEKVSKWVGTLEVFGHDADGVVVKLVGMPPMLSTWAEGRIEMHLYNPFASSAKKMLAEEETRPEKNPEGLIS